jgi:hypothetical protein
MTSFSVVPEELYDVVCWIFFFFMGAGYRLVHVGISWAVNFGHDEDLELWR